MSRTVVSMVLNISVAQQMLDALLHPSDRLAQAFPKEVCTLTKAAPDTARSAVVDCLGI